MSSCKGLLLTLFLIAGAFSQTNFHSTCSNVSLIPLLATGTINLNLQDTYNAGANKDYYQDLSLAQFNTVDVLGYAFAIAGFQANCGQSYYSLGVTVVEFQNQNTRMNIVVNFMSNPNDGGITNSITKWNLVTLTYIVVSRSLNGAYSDIWATVAEVNINNQAFTNSAIDSIGSAFQQGPGVNNDCQMYIDPSLTVNLQTCNNAVAANGETTGGTPIIHAYVMGFQWNPSKSTTVFLGASVLNGNGGAPNPTSDSQGWTIGYTQGAATGPQVTINNYGGALEWIKIGFVYSRLDEAATDYPLNSDLLYSSSYIYTQVINFNVTVPLDPGASGQFNSHYTRLPDARYAIYGLSAFTLPYGNTTSCTQLYVNATLNSISSYTVTTPNIAPTNVFFSADIFTVNVDVLCASNITGVPTITDIDTVAKKSYFTVPTQSLEQYILEDDVTSPSEGLTNNPDAIYLGYSGIVNGNNDTIVFRAEIPFIDLTVGAPTQFEFGFYELADTSSGGFALGNTYSLLVQVNGFTIYQNTTAPAQDSAATPGINNLLHIYKGLNINSSTADVVITLSFQRSLTVNQNVFTLIAVSQYIAAYDPTTGCCVTNCPTLTGLDVSIVPPICVYCNTQAGLYYNPNNGTCTCLSGYYLDSTTTFQCYPCSALYCAICTPSSPTQCTTCVNGANLNNITAACSCGKGFFVNGTACQQCPYSCQTCNSPLGTCSTCVDTQHRDITKNCGCILGYFDSGNVNCTACSQICLGCNNASACTSCDPTKFRNLTGTVCVCQNGYYEQYLNNLTRVCQPCNPECLTCTTSPTSCTSCDATKNRYIGVDDSGHSTCLCQPGYYSTADGSCVQSNCNVDPFCSQCEASLKLCIQCLASKFRVIQLPASICVCENGYYADANNTCQPCASGCGICTSATNCTSCVTLAVNQNNGQCSCPNQTFFTISIDGVRYCSNCGPYCQACSSASVCTTCLPSYTLTSDGECVCSVKNYVNPSGKCVPCASGCQICTSNTTCTKCIDPLVLQGAVCQASCSNGSTVSGSVCLSCPTGCLQCTQNFNCYYCADNYYLYNGQCYNVCPAGTIGDSSTGNWVCDPCNAPCQTCINHPSFCTSCQVGKGYLQTSAVDQSCVENCIDGTYASNGVCQVCDFKCATCLGSSTNCISCPQGQLLYEGGCWATCPAILLTDSSGGNTCTNSCPSGFYEYSQSTCAPCSPQCVTCESGPDNCTSCLQGAVSTNGTCTVNCPQNQFNFQGICIACSNSCNGCQYNPTNCLSCAQGYVLTGSICQQGCLSSQYFDTTVNRCIACDPSCSTCSGLKYCTTCANPIITPRGGVCSSCPYPCSTCDGTGTCTSCLSGFYFFQSQCQQSCPAGSSPNNGVCRCNSGIISNGQCVTSCATGFTSISGICQPCNSNCAQCSGNINSCTSCINGYTIDATTQTCVSSTQCPYGQESNNGDCENICDTSFYYYQGICIYGGCFSGYSDNGFGGCIRNTAAQTASNPTSSTGISCSNGQFTLNGNCVSNCGAGYYPNANTGACLPCSTNCAACLSASFCATCQSGYQSQSGSCVAVTACSSTQFQYNNACVASCPIGTSQSNGACVRTCPATTYYLSQICYISCPTNLRTADACVQTCPTGTSPNNGVCS